MANKDLSKEEIFETLLAEGWQMESARLITENLDNLELNKAIRKLVSRIKNIPHFEPRKKGKPKKFINAAIRKAVFERDAYRCVQCGDWHNLSIDHIKPESLGGGLTLNNLQTLCIKCNCKKGNKYVG